MHIESVNRNDECAYYDDLKRIFEFNRDRLLDIASWKKRTFYIK